MPFPRLAMLIAASLLTLAAPSLAQTPPPPAPAAPQPKPGDPFGEEAARASSTAIAAGLVRMSTTTISLPRPFIFTNAWPASALIGRTFSPTLYGERLAPRQPLHMAVGTKRRANQALPCYEGAPLCRAGGVQVGRVRCRFRASQC